MWDNTNTAGQVCFQSAWKTSGWHGEFHNDEGLISVLYHYGVDETKMKTCMLYKTGINEWKRKDGCRRTFHLRYEQQVQYCDNCKCFHLTDYEDVRAGFELVHLR